MLQHNGGLERTLHSTIFPGADDNIRHFAPATAEFGLPRTVNDQNQEPTSGLHLAASSTKLRHTDTSEPYRTMVKLRHRLDRTVLRLMLVALLSFVAHSSAVSAAAANCQSHEHGQDVGLHLLGLSEAGDHHPSVPDEHGGRVCCGDFCVAAVLGQAAGELAVVRLIPDPDKRQTGIGLRPTPIDRPPA